jgi:hypothetical protein
MSIIRCITIVHANSYFNEQYLLFLLLLTETVREIVILEANIS